MADRRRPAPPPPPPPLNSGAILEALDRHRVRYVLIGGLAAVAYGSHLVTADIDITPAPDRANLGRLAAALRELEAKLRVPDQEYPVDFPLDERTFDRFTTATFRTRHGDLDVVLRPDAPGGRSFTHKQLAERSVIREAFGMKIRLAALEDIIASKEASARDRDLAALPMLHRLREQLRREQGAT